MLPIILRSEMLRLPGKAHWKNVSQSQIYLSCAPSDSMLTYWANCSPLSCFAFLSKVTLVLTHICLSHRVDNGDPVNLYANTITITHCLCHRPVFRRSALTEIRVPSACVCPTDGFGNWSTGSTTTHCDMAFRYLGGPLIFQLTHVAEIRVFPSRIYVRNGINIAIVGSVVVNHCASKYFNRKSPFVRSLLAYCRWSFVSPCHF